MRINIKSCVSSITAIFLSVTTLAPAWAQSTSEELTRLLRFADIHQNKVSFVYSGDIYIVPVAGGYATKLTSGKGLELFGIGMLDIEKK